MKFLLQSADEYYQMNMQMGMSQNEIDIAIRVHISQNYYEVSKILQSEAYRTLE